MIRIAFAVFPLFLVIATAEAQERTLAHMEGCLVWNRTGNIAALNECSRPLTLKFMDADTQQAVTTDVAPGARFTADAVWGKTVRFMFTACPLGFRPSVPFTLENKEAISLSLYNCVAGEPTS